MELVELWEVAMRQVDVPKVGKLGERWKQEVLPGGTTMLGLFSAILPGG